MREPPRDGGLKRGEQIAPRVQEDESRPAEHPLEDAGRVEVAPEIVEVERDDPEPVVVVDEREGAQYRASVHTAFASTIALDR